MKNLGVGLRLSHTSGLTSSDSFRERITLNRKWSDITPDLFLFRLSVQPVLKLAPERFQGTSPWLVREEQTLSSECLCVAHDQVYNVLVRLQDTLHAWGNLRREGCEYAILF